MMNRIIFRYVGPRYTHAFPSPHIILQAHIPSIYDQKNNIKSYFNILIKSVKVFWTMFLKKFRNQFLTADINDDPITTV